MSVLVFIREHHPDEQLWRRKEGSRMRRGEIELHGIPDSLNHPSGSSGTTIFLQIDVGP